VFGSGDKAGYENIVPLLVPLLVLIMVLVLCWVKNTTLLCLVMKTMSTTKMLCYVDTLNLAHDGASVVFGYGD